MTLKTSSLDRYALLLFLSTVFCLVTFIFFGLSQLSTERKLLYEGSDKGRNERSTPRSFILPATPAVALEQERKKIVSEHEVQIKYCILKLHDLGYRIINFDDIFNIQIMIAIMDFQKKNGLEVSGEFDVKTIGNLGCKL
jgi:peptidoglycan hydrolase-like protein with peptidoglycan-binding domain